jgi:hypothetical protein
MSSFDERWLVGASGAFGLPLWALGAMAALVVFGLAVALRRSGWVQSVAGQGFVLIGLVGAGVMLDRLAAQPRASDRSERADAQRAPLSERQVLEARAFDLTARAIMPGSALACLDSGAGDAVEDACEKSVFGSAQAAAAAVAYVSARLSLLADGLDYAKRADAGYEKNLDNWRRYVELDRYGLVAQVLSMHNRCTADDCDAFALLRDASIVRTNLRDRTFDSLVARYAEQWKARQDGPVLASALPGAARVGLPVARNMDFPSAASIPAISIMSPEPSAIPSMLAGTAAGGATDQAPAAPAKKSATTAATEATPAPSKRAAFADGASVPAAAPTKRAANTRRQQTTQEGAAPQAAPTSILPAAERAGPAAPAETGGQSGLR